VDYGGRLPQPIDQPQELFHDLTGNLEVLAHVEHIYKLQAVACITFSVAVRIGLIYYLIRTFA
jgi:hypothetical protein